MNGFGKAKRGQAAIEYLMTYGWALLVIAIVIVALYVIMNTQVRSEKCVTSTGFSCDPVPQVFVDSNGFASMSLRLYNSQMKGITVSRVLCTTAPTSQADPANAMVVPSADAEIPNGFSGTFTNVPCKNGANQLKLASGQQFNGYFVVWYNYENDPDPTVARKLEASVSTSIVKK